MMSKTDLSPWLFFLLSIQRLILCCNFRLYMRRSLTFFSYVAFVVSVFVSQFSFFYFLGVAVSIACDISLGVCTYIYGKFRENINLYPVCLDFCMLRHVTM